MSGTSTLKYTKRRGINERKTNKKIIFLIRIFSFTRGKSKGIFKEKPVKILDDVCSSTLKAHT